MSSNSRGSVQAVSPCIADKPDIRFNYLSTPEDEFEWVEAVQKVRDILQQPAFSDYDGGETSPGPAVKSPSQILQWVRRDGETAYHPSCSCKMGVDDMAVVEPDSLRVHGLRVLLSCQLSSGFVCF
jgi:choline dehydrogenase